MKRVESLPHNQSSSQVMNPTIDPITLTIEEEGQTGKAFK